MSTFPRMHVSLYVSDIRKTVDFYSAFFNQQPEKVKTDYAKYILSEPSLIISFVQNPERVKAQFGHLGFQVEHKEEMEARLAAVQSSGMETVIETGTACCYAVQDKFWVNDPDGHQWEVYYFHEDAEFNDPYYESESASACCMPPETEKKKVNLADISNAKTCKPDSGCC